MRLKKLILPEWGLILRVVVSNGGLYRAVYSYRIKYLNRLEYFFLVLLVQ